MYKEISSKQLLNFNKILEASKDVKYLLSRRYNFESVINFVSTRYMLNSLEKQILIRLFSGYNIKFKKLKTIRTETLIIDGYNILITVSVMINKGILIKSIDGLIRDIEGKHGKFIDLEIMKTSVDVIENFIRNTLKFKKEVIIVLEKNISKSGELAKYINHYTSMKAILEKQVDNFIIANSTRATISTSDSLIIGKIGKVYPITLYMLKYYKPKILVSLKRVYFFD